MQNTRPFNDDESSFEIPRQPPLPPEQFQQLDQLCDEFESIWKSGSSRPQISDFLSKISPERREEILRELIKLDLHYREQLGEAPSLADYETQFPQYTEVLRQLQAQLPTFILQPRELGHLKLTRHVGRGTFGDVWYAFDKQLQRYVAVKTPRERQPDAESVSRFLREARSIARIQHPNVVTVHHAGEMNGRAFIVSEFVEGPTLKDWIKQREVTPESAARVCQGIALGLAAAHLADVVHRDLKPANILMAPGDIPKIVDFGLAKHLDTNTTLGAEGTVMGTLAYMSPEQAKGHSSKIDGRSDVYSLGVILYELLTNRVPYKGSYNEVIGQIIADTSPAAPRTFNRTLPIDLETICLTALEKSPQHRYQSAAEMADDLARFESGEPLRAQRPSCWERGRRWIRRHPAAAALVVLGALSSFALGGYGWQQYEDYRAARQLVSLTTDPPGANVLFVPLDPLTQEPVPTNKVEAGQSPVSTWLLPGDYLVVAYTDTEHFHEVFRHVPSTEEMNVIPGAHRHQRWSLEGGEIVLTPVTLWQQRELVADMVAEPVSGKVYLDRTEFTVGDYERVQGEPWKAMAGCSKALPVDYAAACISFDEAMMILERAGKRLPTYEEFQRFSGRADFEWPLQLDQPVTAGSIREVDSGNLYGLTSGVAEWTFSPPVQIAAGKLLTSEQKSRRVFGRISEGQIELEGISITTWSEKIGMRGVRSTAPRYSGLSK